eukprot:6184628-Pleurochrysis_carterae.AAC.1
MRPSESALAARTSPALLCAARALVLRPSRVGDPPMRPAHATRPCDPPMRPAHATRPCDSALQLASATRLCDFPLALVAVSIVNRRALVSDLHHDHLPGSLLVRLPPPPVIPPSARPLSRPSARIHPRRRVESCSAPLTAAAAPTAICPSVSAAAAGSTPARPSSTSRGWAPTPTVCR